MQNNNRATQVRDKSSQQRVIEYTPLVSLHEGERRGAHVAPSKPTYKVNKEQQHIWCRAFYYIPNPDSMLQANSESEERRKERRRGAKGEGMSARAG